MFWFYSSDLRFTLPKFFSWLICHINNTCGLTKLHFISSKKGLKSHFAATSFLSEFFYVFLKSLKAKISKKSKALSRRHKTWPNISVICMKSFISFLFQVHFHDNDKKSSQCIRVKQIEKSHYVYKITINKQNGPCVRLNECSRCQSSKNLATGHINFKRYEYSHKNAPIKLNSQQNVVLLLFYQLN